MNAYERREQERKIKQRQRNLNRRADTCIKQHRIILRFENIYYQRFGKWPNVVFKVGRYYVGGRSYQEQQILHKIMEMEASLHEEELCGTTDTR